MKTCLRCGGGASASAQFCSWCGLSLTPKPKPSTGQKVAVVLAILFGLPVTIIVVLLLIGFIHGASGG
jgi:hypothetical protein